MFEFALWLLFGAIIGWIGSLVSRTDDHNQALVPYVGIGAIGAMLGGFASHNFGSTSANGLLSMNPNSMTIAIFTATICVLALSFFGKTSSN